MLGIGLNRLNKIDERVPIFAEPAIRQPPFSTCIRIAWIELQTHAQIADGRIEAIPFRFQFPPQKIDERVIRQEADELRQVVVCLFRTSESDAQVGA